MKVAILIPFVSDYMRGENGDPLYFQNTNEAMKYLADRNFTAQYLAELVYEEIEE
jgi:hypothetical protein